MKSPWKRPPSPCSRKRPKPASTNPCTFYNSYPRIQILSIEELLAGQQLEYPRLLELTYKKAPRARVVAEQKMALPFGGAAEEEPF
jgi:hypothetical protein